MEVGHLRIVNTSGTPDSTRVTTAEGESIPVISDNLMRVTVEIAPDQLVKASLDVEFMHLDVLVDYRNVKLNQNALKALEQVLVANLFDGNVQQKTGLQRIAEERFQQVFTAEHDDQHTHGELAQAAGVYMDAYFLPASEPPARWPWDAHWYRPSKTGNAVQDRIKDLTKAGALIAAEIDRLQRL